jgi:hypothetical protein
VNTSTNYPANNIQEHNTKEAARNTKNTQSSVNVEYTAVLPRLKTKGGVENFFASISRYTCSGTLCHRIAMARSYCKNKNGIMV